MKSLACLLFSVLLLAGCGGDGQLTRGVWPEGTGMLRGHQGRFQIFVILRTESLPDSGKTVAQINLEAAEPAGAGTVFEASSRNVERDGQRLKFQWTDAFGNRGTGILQPIADEPGIYRLELSAGELAEPRIAPYLRRYRLHLESAAP